MSSPKIRVAICGGGISGLCLAVALSRHDHLDVQLYEATGQFKEIGAGVMIWSRTWRILQLMGLADGFDSIAHKSPSETVQTGFEFRRSDPPHGDGFKFHRTEMTYGCIRFHRAAFLDVFVDNLPPGIANFGKQLTSYEHAQGFGSSSSSSSGLITLRFADGSRAECDLLVGCDGIKSTIRQLMFGRAAVSRSESELLNYVDPVWTGTIAYRGLVPVRNIPKRADGSVHSMTTTPMMYCGNSKHVVGYSISQGEIVNVVTFTSEPEKRGTTYDGPWVTDCSREELLNAYHSWEPEVGEILKLIENPTRWAIHEMRPLPFYAENRVVLLGDAAHAMSPHQGAGAGQAIEDSFILAAVLGKARLATIDAAIKAYESVRLSKANHVLSGSYDSGAMYEFNSVWSDRYAELGPAIDRQWDWIHETTPEGEAERAIALYTDGCDL